MTTDSENNSDMERSESELLLDAQDADNADAFLRENYPSYCTSEVPKGLLVIIGHLIRENRMLANLAKSNDSSNTSPKLQTSDPPFAKPPEFVQPCVAVDRAAGRIRNPSVARPSREFDLNPAAIRRSDESSEFRYRKPNAGIIRK